MSVTRVIADFVWGATMVWALAKSWRPKRESICTAPWAIGLSAVLSGVIYAALNAWWNAAAVCNCRLLERLF